MRLPPELVARYRPLRTLGRGAQGRVYLAEDLSNRELVALKVLEGIPNPEALLRMRQEAALTASIRHPHVVRVLEFEEVSASSMAIVSEFLDGVELRDWVETQGVRARQKFVPFSEQMFSALEVLHQKGILHRDLKPVNVMVVEEGARVVLLDLGLALDDSQTTRLTRTGALVGTPRFFAPELIDRGTYDPRCDLWALSHLMHLIYHQVLPPPQEHLLRCFPELRARSYTLELSWDRPEHEEFFRIVLDPIPENRPATAVEARDLFRRAFTEVGTPGPLRPPPLPVSAPPFGIPGPSPGGPAPRAQPPAGIYVFLALVGVVVASAWLQPRGGFPPRPRASLEAASGALPEASSDPREEGAPWAQAEAQLGREARLLETVLADSFGSSEPLALGFVRHHGWRVALGVFQSSRLEEAWKRYLRALRIWIRDSALQPEADRWRVFRRAYFSSASNLLQLYRGLNQSLDDNVHRLLVGEPDPKLQALLGSWPAKKLLYRDPALAFLEELPSGPGASRIPVALRLGFHATLFQDRPAWDFERLLAEFEDASTAGLRFDLGVLLGDSLTHRAKGSVDCEEDLAALRAYGEAVTRPHGDPLLVRGILRAQLLGGILRSFQICPSGATYPPEDREARGLESLAVLEEILQAEVAARPLAHWVRGLHAGVKGVGHLPTSSKLMAGLLELDQEARSLPPRWGEFFFALDAASGSSARGSSKPE